MALKDLRGALTTLLTPGIGAVQSSYTPRVLITAGDRRRAGMQRSAGLLVDAERERDALAAVRAVMTGEEVHR